MVFTPLMTIIAVAIAALIVGGILFWAVPYLIKNKLGVTTYLNISGEVLSTLERFLGVLGLPTKEQQNIDSVIKYAELAVNYAEQMYATGQLSSAQRLQAAIGFIEKAAAAAKLQLSPLDLELAKAIIEAMVFLLPKSTPVLPVASGTTPVTSGTQPKA